MKRNLCGLMAALLMLSACQHHSQKADRYFPAFSQCNNVEPYRAAQNQLMEELFQQKGDVQLVIADAQQESAQKKMVEVSQDTASGTASRPMCVRQDAFS